TVADATRRTRELMTAHRRAETTLIQPAPHSPHGASPAMIRAGWEIAEDEDTRFHIHVAEGQYEGERTRREHGATPIRYLDGLGARSGAEVLGLEAGVLAPGALADLVAVDLDDASLHPRTDVLKSIVYAMSPRAVTDVWVHGRRVVARGRLATVDAGALLASVREVTRGWSI